MPDLPHRNAEVAQRVTNHLADYRRWAESDQYPQRGSVSFLNGIIWVDTSMEELLTHNRVKPPLNLTRWPGLFAEAEGALANRAPFLW